MLPVTEYINFPRAPDSLALATLRPRACKLNRGNEKRGKKALSIPVFVMVQGDVIGKRIYKESREGFKQYRNGNFDTT